MKIQYLLTAVLMLALAMSPSSSLGQEIGAVETTMISLKIEGKNVFNLITWVLVLPDAPITVGGKLEGAANEPLGSKTIELSSDFGFSATVTTDGFGEFEFETYAPKAEGIYWIYAEFKGDDNYASSRGSIAFEVNRATSLLQIILQWLLIATGVLAIFIVIIFVHKKEVSKRQKEIMVRCTRCGSLNDDNAFYCTNSGHQLVGRRQ